MTGEEDPRELADLEQTLMRGIGPTRTRRQGSAHLSVLVLTALAQGGVLFYTAVMGLMWDGWTYTAALLQAYLLGGVLLLLATWRSRLALAVPLISAAISLGLYMHFVKLDTEPACTSDMREATAQVKPLPGTNVTFDGEVENGCIARFTAPVSKTGSVIPHYRRELARHGWEITDDEGPHDLVAVRGRIVIRVMVPGGAEGGLVVIQVDHTASPGTTAP